MANTTYKVIGKQRGSFTTKEGQNIEFKHLFVTQPIVFPADSHATFEGVKTDKLKCNDKAFDKVVLGGCYDFYFDKFGSVVMVDAAADFDSSDVPFKLKA